MQWLVAVLSAVLHDPKVVRAFRALLLAVLSAALAALGLSAVLPPGLLPSGL